MLISNDEQPKVVNGPPFEAGTRPEPDIYFLNPI